MNCTWIEINITDIYLNSSIPYSKQNKDVKSFLRSQLPISFRTKSITWNFEIDFTLGITQKITLWNT